jgi:hypothetical protein
LISKVIFWIVVVFVILFALRMWNAAKARGRPGPGRAAAADPQLMVRCVRCGTFLPKADATAPEGFRCSDPACAQHSSGSR